MVSCVNRGGGNVNEQIRKHCKISKVNQAHQVGQDYFDRQEMPRGVEQDAPVREPGEVADGRSIDAFLHARNKSASMSSHNPKPTQIFSESLTAP